MLEFSSERYFREFSGGLTPIAELPLNEAVRIHTQDCYTGQIGRDGSEGPSMGPNPATGPFYIPGAEKGDTLAVRILHIGLPEYGCMRVYPDTSIGAMGEVITRREVQVLPIEDGYATLDGVRVPLRPMIGVIGVAPAEGLTIDNDTPGKHGGNMDDNRIGEGATVYLPVSVPGALFGLGDLHAQMGDGEVAICGLEIAGYVDLELSLIKGRQESWPVVERDGGFSVNCSAGTLDEAAYLSRYALYAFIRRRTSLSPEHIAMLQSLVCDLSVCQIVDPLVTVRMALRPGILELAF